MQPLSVVAVVCGGKLTFGIWADTSTFSRLTPLLTLFCAYYLTVRTSSRPLEDALGDMGEVSVYLAQVCFGTGMNGDAGYDNPDVLYVAFPGEKSETVPSKEGKDLNEIATLGQGLVQKVFGSGGGVVSGGTGNVTGVSGASPSGGRASWTGGGGGELSGQASATSAGVGGGSSGGTGSGGATGAGEVTGAAPTPTGNSAATASSASEGGTGGLSTGGGTTGSSTSPEGFSSALLGNTGMCVLFLYPAWLETPDLPNRAFPPSSRSQHNYSALHRRRMHSSATRCRRRLGGDAAWTAWQAVQERKQERRDKRQRVGCGDCTAVKAYGSKNPEQRVRVERDGIERDGRGEAFAGVWQEAVDSTA